MLIVVYVFCLFFLVPKENISLSICNYVALGVSSNGPATIVNCPAIPFDLLNYAFWRHSRTAAALKPLMAMWCPQPQSDACYELREWKMQIHYTSLSDWPCILLRQNAMTMNLYVVCIYYARRCCCYCECGCGSILWWLFLENV